MLQAMTFTPVKKDADGVYREISPEETTEAAAAAPESERSGLQRLLYGSDESNAPITDEKREQLRPVIEGAAAADFSPENAARFGERVPDQLQNAALGGALGVTGGPAGVIAGAAGGFLQDPESGGAQATNAGQTIASFAANKLANKTHIPVALKGVQAALQKLGPGSREGLATLFGGEVGNQIDGLRPNGAQMSVNERIFDAGASGSLTALMNKAGNFFSGSSELDDISADLQKARMQIDGPPQTVRAATRSQEFRTFMRGNDTFAQDISRTGSNAADELFPVDWGVDDIRKTIRRAKSLMETTPGAGNEALMARLSAALNDSSPSGEQLLRTAFGDADNITDTVDAMRGLQIAFADEPETMRRLTNSWVRRVWIGDAMVEAKFAGKGGNSAKKILDRVEETVDPRGTLEGVGANRTSGFRPSATQEQNVLGEGSDYILSGTILKNQLDHVIEGNLEAVMVLGYGDKEAGKKALSGLKSLTRVMDLLDPQSSVTRSALIHNATSKQAQYMARNMAFRAMTNPQGGTAGSGIAQGAGILGTLMTGAYAIDHVAQVVIKNPAMMEFLEAALQGDSQIALNHAFRQFHSAMASDRVNSIESFAGVTPAPTTGN